MQVALSVGLSSTDDFTELCYSDRPASDSERRVEAERCVEAARRRRRARSGHVGPQLANSSTRSPVTSPRPQFHCLFLLRLPAAPQHRSAPQQLRAALLMPLPA